ncbi:MAG: DUF305 domain-containing protein [Frankiales bacterium]|nr:DUF305 domain-containing protein [Frankiales bacterium]
MTAEPPTSASVHHHHDDALSRRRPPAWLVPAGLALAIAGLLGGLLLGHGMAADGAAQVDDPVSVGFVRDMSTHHAQAVRMSEIAHRRSTDPELTYLAFDILSTQQGQIGIMSGWLDLWNQFQSSPAGRQMEWMGHTGPMPGMATDPEIAALDTLPAAQMEERWLRLMIRHHRGAVPMADAAASGADSPDVALLAAKMSQGQQSEIDAMQDMLRRRGLSPEPQSTAPAHGTGHSAVQSPAATHDGH